MAERSPLTVVPSAPILVLMHASKRVEVYLVVGLVVALVLLAIGIGGLRLLPGQPFSLSSSGTFASQGTQATGPSSGAMLTVIQLIMLAAVAGIPLVIIYALLSREGRLKLIANLSILGMLIAVLLVLENNTRLPVVTQNQSQPKLPATPSNATGPTFPGATFNPSTSETAVVAISLAVGLLISAVLAFVIWRAWKRRHPPSDKELEALADQAQDAMDALRSGGDLRDVVLHCYRVMSRTLQRERGLQRQPAMTAREFEQTLQGKGVPLEAVRNLTDLFERVRYGHEPLGPQAEKDAMTSLDALVTVLRTPKEDALWHGQSGQGLPGQNLPT